MYSRLRAGTDVSLATIDTSATPGWKKGKRAARKRLAKGGLELNLLQEQLFAESRNGSKRGLLLVIQAMDTAGKSGIVQHVIGAIDPEGVKAHAFKAPTALEKRHDFLWRIRKELPSAGCIGVFDRSHYEDVLIHRVLGLSPAEVIEERYGLIADFEAEVAASGIAIIKVMLHVGLKEQKARLLARLARVEKQWKYNPADMDQRALWPKYQEAYEIAIRRTATPDAPWYVVPADHKWYARLAVQELLIEQLEAMKLQWPAPDFDVAAEKKRVRAS